MDWLAARNLIEAATRVSPIGNALVLVGPADRPAPAGLRLDRGGTALLSLLGANGRIAAGDPAHVPAGRYAEAALTWLKTPNAALFRASPLSLLDTDIGAESVMDTLGRIEHGVFA